MPPPRSQQMVPGPQTWFPHWAPAKAVPIPVRPRMLPIAVAAIVLRAARREGEVAKPLVKSSKRVESMSTPSFVNGQHSGASAQHVRACATG